MSQNSKIEWTGSTWNPIRARLIADIQIPTKSNPFRIVPAGTWGYHCERVSPGCSNCYACTMNGRTLPAWGTGLDYTVPNRDKVEIYLDEVELQKPLHWKAPRKIFPCSMTDWCADFVTDEMRDRMLAVAALTPRHDYQFLTKRAKQMREYFKGINQRRRGYWCEHGGYLQDVAVKTGIVSDERAGELVRAAVKHWKPHLPAKPESLGDSSVYHVPWPLPNAWLGVSIEDRQRKSRIDELRETPAAVRFLSLEPLLEDLGKLDLRGIDWAIVGGESGPGARPMDLVWVRSIVEQCKAADVPCFVKQLGRYPVMSRDAGAAFCPDYEFRLVDKKGGDPEEWPADLRVREMPASRAPLIQGKSGKRAPTLPSSALY